MQISFEGLCWIPSMCKVNVKQTNCKRCLCMLILNNLKFKSVQKYHIISVTDSSEVAGCYMFM